MMFPKEAIDLLVNRLLELAVVPIYKQFPAPILALQVENYAKTEEAKIEDLITAVAYSSE